jgi:NTE family protein
MTKLRPSFFEGVPTEALEEILSRLERRRYPARSIVIAEGDRPRDIFIAQSGTADVFVTDRRGVEHPVGQIVPGATIGEMSLFTGQPAAGTVRANEELEVLIMTESDFERTCASFPQVYRNLGAILSDRLAKTNRLTMREDPGRLTILEDRGAPPILGYALASSLAWHSQASTVLVVLDGSPSDELASIAATCDARAQAAASDGRPLPNAELRLAASKGQYAPEAVESTIKQLCDRYDHVLVQTRDAFRSDLHSARHLQLCGRNGIRPADAPGPLVRAWEKGDGKPPDRTGIACIPPLEAADQEGLRAGLLTLKTPAGRRIGWLARDLAGLKVGVALGAGSIRGFAHLGVLRVLEREHVPIDYVAGTSIGAAVGGLYALGLTMDEQQERLMEAAKRLFRPALPIRGLLSSRALYKYLSSVSPGVRIEDLDVPFAAVAADLKTRREIIFRRGLLHDAVLASLSIPGVYPAVRIGPYLCTDGGIINPVPTSAAEELGAGTVIGVRLIRHSGAADADAEAVRERGKVPTAVSAIVRSIDIMQTGFTPPPSEAATVIITPEMAEIRSARLRNFSEGQSFVHDGAAAAEEALPRIAAALPWLRKRQSA